MNPSRLMSRLPQLIAMPEGHPLVCSIVEVESLPHAGLSLDSQSNTPGAHCQRPLPTAGFAYFPVSLSSIFCAYQNRILGGGFKDNDT